jgi:hypothetical protein
MLQDASEQDKILLITQSISSRIECLVFPHLSALESR